MVRNLFVAAATVAVMSVVASPVSAQFGTGNSPNNLFSQYHTQPGASQVQSSMYPAPHHVPANVGHSYYTYQPLMPHEMMYTHNRNYYNYYNTGGYSGGYDALNKTQVRWQSGANHMGPLPFSGALYQGLQWNYQKRRYCIGGDCGGGVGGGIGSRRGSLRGHVGCADGNCDSYGSDAYGSDVYGGGCASGSCATKLTDEANSPIQR